MEIGRQVRQTRIGRRLLLRSVLQPLSLTKRYHSNIWMGCGGETEREDSVRRAEGGNGYGVLDKEEAQV